MLCFPNCKINLGLYITARREDGYHDLATVFYPVQFQDALEVVPAEVTTLNVTGLKLGSNVQDNLVWKAYELLKLQYPGEIPALAIHLQKAIPMGAGLGGGSADGAWMLRLINDYCQLNLDNSTLANLALQLGSDCPFFIYNTPKFASGRGEQMSDVQIDLSAYSLQLICPKVHVSTRDAFSNIVPKATPFNLQHLGTLPMEQWKTHVSNDFEITVFKQHPVLAAIKEQLYVQGAIYASMSGTGSAVYGFFPKGSKAKVNVPIQFKEVWME